MSCNKECKCHSFGFRCNAEEVKLFYVSQWSRNRMFFFIYRLVMALHSLGWTVGFYVWCKVHCRDQMEHSYRYITLWADFLRTTYFVAATILVLLGLDQDQSSVEDRGLARRLRMVVWFLHNLAMSSNTAVAVFYWPFVAPHIDPDIARSVINVFFHAVNLVLMVIDLLIVAFPIRLLHMVYSMLLGLVYCLHTIILWRVNDTHAVYGILDWENNPVVAGGFFVASIFIGTPVVQLITFGVHILRKNCYSALQNSGEEDVNDNLENFPLKADDDKEMKAAENSSVTDKA